MPSVYVPGGGAPTESDIKDKAEEEIKVQDAASGSGKTNNENHQKDGSQIPSVYVPGGGAPPESDTIKDKVEEDIEVQDTSGGGKNDDNNQKDGSQVPSLYVPGGGAPPESEVVVSSSCPQAEESTTVSPNEELPPETAPSNTPSPATKPDLSAQTNDDNDEKKEDEEGGKTEDDAQQQEQQQQEEERKSIAQLISSAPTAVLAGMKNLTGRINRMNRDQRNFQRQWTKLKKAFATLSRNFKGLLNAFGGGGGGGN